MFDELKLPGGKRTPSGTWGTDASVLQTLAEQGFDLPQRVLEWRQLAKLKSTYADALVQEINPATNRVHTSYAMAATSTGRISSNDPNLQNIPIRTEEGARIRRAFVAEAGNVLVSADYSQIELRLLAHVADIPALKDAMRAPPVRCLVFRSRRWTARHGGGPRRLISALFTAFPPLGWRGSSASKPVRRRRISTRISCATRGFALIWSGPRKKRASMGMC
jgi:hypothetical protein